MLSHGNPVELSKLGKQEVFFPVRNQNGIIGVLRVIFTGAEILTFFIPGVGPVASAGIGLAFSGAQAALTLASYEQGNIRSTSQLFGALALDILPAGVFFGQAVTRTIRTELIVVESLEAVAESQKVTAVYTRKSSEFRDNLKMLKTQGVKTLDRVNSVGGMERVSRLKSSEVIKYRQAYIKATAREGEDTSLITFDQFEVAMNNAFPNATNKDRALIRNLKLYKNLSGRSYKYTEDYIDLIVNVEDALSPQVKTYIANQGKDPRQVLDGLTQYVESRKLTSRINRIFASGESDWATKEFWKHVRNGKILKSGNFWTQAAQSFNANDVGREIISKPFNALIRQNKKLMDRTREKLLKRLIAKYGDEILDQETKVMKEVTKLNREYRNQIKNINKWNAKQGKETPSWMKKKIAKSIYKGSVYANKLQKSIEKAGGYYCGESFVMGWRVIQNTGQTKVVQIHFNRITTNAVSAGSKNRGGKPDVIMPMTDYQLRRWRRSPNKSSYYLRHFALSRGGRPIGYQLSSHIFSNFLIMIPLPALRNVLSVISNIKSVGKDIAKGTYFKEWFGNFEKTVKRLWIHKVGKLAGSSLGIFGKGAGKEGQRFGLAIARGFQHSEGQRLGAFSIRPLVKEALPQGFRGASLRAGRKRIRGGKLPSVGQTKLSTGRYLTNMRRIGSIPKI